MSEPEALFVPDGDRYVPTEVARGPWDPRALHGGPVAALLAGALEDDGFVLTRMTLELLRPVPVEPLAVRTTLVRPGRKVQLASASLAAGEAEVARAVALRLRRADFDVPGSDAVEAELPGPDAGRPPTDRWTWRAFHNSGVEMRFVAGMFDEPGPCTVWMRLRQPVVAGQEPTPVQRAAAVADFGNGISSVLSFDEWQFINPDLTVYLVRPPVGEWVALDSRTWPGPAGVAMAESALHDERGRIGRAVQSLIVDRR